MTADLSVHLEWHRHWSASVAAAFTALPYDHLMDPVVVEALWRSDRTRGPQRIGIVRDQDEQPVGLLPLKKIEFRGWMSWQLLTFRVLPYARFFVLPAYTEATLAALHRYLACDAVSFTATPPRRYAQLKPEDSWITDLRGGYDAVLRRAHYASEARRIWRRASALQLSEDDFADLPEIVHHWAEKWRSRGYFHTTNREHAFLATYQMLSKEGKLKVFTLRDGNTLAAAGIHMIGPDSLYYLMTFMDERYKKQHAGIRVLLAALEWACAQGLAELNFLQYFAYYKSTWATPQVRSYRVTHLPRELQPLDTALDYLRNRYFDVRSALGRVH